MSANQKSADQLKVEAFLQEFVAELTKAYGSEIDFILFFGSAARGEFILGKSDVDLIIQEKIEGFASATKIGDRLLDNVSFFLETKLGLLSEQKREFVREACPDKEERLSGRLAGGAGIQSPGVWNDMGDECGGDTEGRGGNKINYANITFLS